MTIPGSARRLLQPLCLAPPPEVRALLAQVGSLRAPEQAICSPRLSCAC